MTSHKDTKSRYSSAPLETRHVFFDTQVFRSLGHNPANAAMSALKQQVIAQRIVIHTTDITLLEVRRQIHEYVLTRQREQKSIEKDFRRWRKSAPNNAPLERPEFDADSLAAELYEQFVSFLISDCQAIHHKAFDIPADVIFTKYFDRKQPFDGKESKEFPDAFAIESLIRWCQQHSEQLYVVTEDKAMTRAVELDKALLHVRSVHDVLSRAATDLASAGELAAEEVLNSPAFDFSFEEFLRAQIKDAVFVYVGDLPEGEAYQGKFITINEVTDHSTIALSDDRVTLILSVNLQIQVEVQYENRDHASYDKEDDHWFGAEAASTDILEDIEIEVLIEIDRNKIQVRDGKVLTEEIRISGPSDWDY